jgi:hypothetical protein
MGSGMISGWDSVRVSGYRVRCRVRINPCTLQHFRFCLSNTNEMV